VSLCAAKRGWICALPLIAACSGPPALDNHPAGGGTLTVSWQAPTTNTDGTPLKDLTGYTIHYGTRSGSYSTKMSIDDPSATQAVIRGLKPGADYFFVVSADSATGRHSVLSSEAHAKARPQ
jgi:hypothetical protein